MTFKRMMSLIAMAFLWTGSQIPVYIFGGIPPLIYGDIGGTDRWTWFVLANLLALAAVCPFVGSLSDLMGRRYVAIMGAVLIIVGVAIASTAHTMNIFIGKSSTINSCSRDQLLTIVAGMAVAGAGAGINELTALAVTSELAPTRKRGKYVAILVFTIVPFCPSVLWAQLIAEHAGWRYCGVLCGVWAAIGLIMTIIFYFPPPRVNSKGLTKMEVIKQIDYVGGFLSITGMLVFMAGLQWGGYQVCLTFVNDQSPFVNVYAVQLEIRPRPCTAVCRLLTSCRLCRLGSKIRPIPHVSSTHKAKPTYSRPYFNHHMHFRRQLLLCASLLAHTSFQCLRPRSSRRWDPRSANRIQHPYWCCHCTLAAQSFPWSQQRVDDREQYHYDCW